MRTRSEQKYGRNNYDNILLLNCVVRHTLLRDLHHAQIWKTATALFGNPLLTTEEIGKQGSREVGKGSREVGKESDYYTSQISLSNLAKRVI